MLCHNLTRQQSNKLYLDILQAQDERAIRNLALDDLFFLLKVVLRRLDADRDWLYERCREVESCPDGMLDLWAREHYKSTIITYAKTIQDILKKPDITVGIFSHTRPIAKAFLNQLKHEFEANGFLKDLFPDVLYKKPEHESPGWSLDNGIIVKRSSNPKEATVEAWGLVDGQPTSKHYSLLIYDDVVTKESVSTPEQIAKTTEAFALSMNLGAQGGRVRIIGTRYHLFDTYAHIIDQKIAEPRVRAATHDGTPEGRPVFLTAAELEKKKKQGSYVFSCQQLQNPVADKQQGFREEWLCWYDVLRNNHNWNYYIIVDPSSSKKKVDGDFTTMAVIATAHDSNYYFIEGIRDKLNLTEKATRIINLKRKYPTALVGYEEYGMQADREHIELVQDQQNYRFPILALSGNVAKVERIRRLIPIHENRRFYYPRQSLFVDCKGEVHDYIKEFIKDEYISFPVMKHDDMLDCHARIADPAFGVTFPVETTDVPATMLDGEGCDMSLTEYEILG